MNFFISILTILFISFAIQIKFRRTFAESISVSTCTIILLLYVFTLFLPLTYSAYITSCISIIAFIYIIFTLIKNKKMLKQIDFISISFFLFILCCIFIYYAFSKRVASAWDEFSHWMLVIKNMHCFKNFGIGDYTTTCFTGYPPATGLFECFFCIFSSQFIEGNAYIGYNILLLSFLISPLKNDQISSFQKSLTLFVFLFIPMIFYAPYTTLYVDCILAIMFARQLYIYFSEEKFDFFFFYNFCVSSSVLILTKASGTGLYIFAMIAILLDIFIFNKPLLHSYFKIFNVRLNSILTITIIPFLVKLSWDLYLKIYNLRGAWDTSNISLTNFVNLLFFKNIKTYQKITIKNFIDAFFTINEFGDIRLKSSYFLFPIIFTLLMIIVSLLGENKKRTIYLNCILFLSYFTYAFSLLILYIFTYSEREATNIASFTRYMNTITLGYLLVVIMCLWEPSIIHKKMIKEKINKIKFIHSINIIIIICTLFLTSIEIKNHILFSAFNARESQKARENFSYMNILSNKFDYITDKIYYIEQGGNGLNFCIFRYILTPVSINPGSAWSLAISPNLDDPFTQKTTIQQWSQDLKANYTYVYLDIVNDQFINDFSILFEDPYNITNKSLYKVTYSEQDNLVKLILCP